MVKPQPALLAHDPNQLRLARRVIVEHGKASLSLIQRTLGIAWNETVPIMALLEAEGTVSKPDAAGKRSVLIKSLDELDPPTEAEALAAADPAPPTHHDNLQAIVIEAMRDIPGAIGTVCLVLVRGENDRAQYILTATSNGDPEFPFGHVHVEDLLAEGLTWNRVMAKNAVKQQQEIEPAKAKQADLTPTSERAH